MRIGLISFHTSPIEVPGQGDAGGMNVVVREAALALERIGHTVSIATRASDRQPAGMWPLERGSTVVVHALEVGDPSIAKESLPETVGEFGRALASTPGFHDADVIHAHYWLSGVAARDLARAHSIPLVSTLHTVGAQKNAHLAQGATPEPAMRLTAEAQLARESTIVAGSHSEFAAITEAYGTPAPGSRVIHPGVDTALFTPLNSPTLLAPDTHTAEQGISITVLGRVQPLKGQDLAVEAFAECVRHVAHIARTSTLTIAGEPTPGAEAFYADLRARAQEVVATSGGQIRFLASQSRADAARLLRESDLVLVPSHSETFGLVALEAAASGVPVIASHTTGLGEAVRDDVSGVLVNGRDPTEWAQAIAELAADRDARERMQSAARAYALEHDWASHARHLETLYREL